MIEPNPRNMFRGCRQTACRYCGHDIEGFFPYRKGEWRDRGNNPTCPNDSGKQHAPYNGKWELTKENQSND